MSAFKNITGLRFGRLVALEWQGRVKNYSRWLCQCDCGVTKVSRAGDLMQGRVKSCGCLKTEVTRAKNIARRTHGQSATKTWRAWKNMRDHASVQM